MPLTRCFNDYKNHIAKVDALIAAAHATGPPSGAYVWSPDVRTFITESAFLKMFIAWEQFLETSFVLYMMGHPSGMGNIVPKFVSPTDEGHAHRILVGTRRYVDWSTPDTARKLAGSFFASGEPYETVLTLLSNDLMDLKTIRNAAAHLSSSTTQQLDALGTRKLRRPCVNVAVYDLLIAVNPDPSAGGKTILKTYQEILEAAASLIANA